MYLIAGLGNPGKQYTSTRHNIGFSAIDCISRKHNIDVSKIKDPNERKRIQRIQADIALKAAVTDEDIADALDLMM